MDVSLNGKTILITGGTGALGRALVELSLAEGARVLFTYHKNDQEAKKLIAKNAVGFQLDFSNRDQVIAFKEKIRTVTNQLDGVVLNAAITRDKTLAKLETEAFYESLEVNLASIFLMTKSLIGLLRKSECGKILLLTSRSGAHGAFGQTAYATTKAAVVGFMKSLSLEVGRMGICVNAVNPGFLAAGMSETLEPEVMERAKKESVLSEHGDTQEAAQFILYLLSDRARRVSGQIFHWESRTNSS